MNWFNNLFTPTGALPVLSKREVAPAVQIQEREATGVPSSTNEQPQPKGASFEERIITARTPLMALTVSAVHRAIELRMKTMGVMPVQYRKKDAAGGNFTTDMRGLGKRINYLLQEEPNPIMTASSMWELVTYYQVMFGNGFVYIERDEFGFPYRLWLVKTGEYNLVTGQYSFIQYLSDYGYVEEINVPREDVMHFPNTFRYQNTFWGIPTLQFAAGELSLIKTQKNQSLETAAKGGRMKLIIGESPQPNGGFQAISQGLYNKTEMNKYADEVNDRIYQKDVIALRALDKVQNISMSAQDMQLLESLNLSYDDISRYYGVPRPLLMLDTNSHYNDYQNATMEFHTRTILPEKADREKEIFRKLIGFKDYGFRDIHICEKPLLAMDPERQAKVDQLNLQTGAKTVNEIRQEHDMPSVEKGDIVYISTNVAELGSTKLSGESPTELKPGTYTVAEPPAKEGEGEK